MGFDLALFQIVCGLSVFLCIIPLSWHWRNKNIPAISLILWLTVYNICTFSNSFIWPDDLTLFAGWEGGIYCDIQVKLLIGGFAGHLGSLAAISRNLAKILSDEITIVCTKDVRKKELIKDLLLCLGVPVYMMAVHYVVQPRRYYLVTVTGCTTAVDRSWPSIVLIFIWPPAMALTAGYFSILVLHRMHKVRRRFTTVLSSSHTSITKSRFLRLFILSVMLLIILGPVSFYTFSRNLGVERLPYDWAEVHGEGWLWIRKIPTGGHIYFDRWIPVGTAIMVFLIFGLGRDAMAMYRGWLNAIGIGNYLPKLIMNPMVIIPRPKFGSASGDCMAATSPVSKLSKGKCTDNGISTVITDLTCVTIDDGVWPPRPKQAMQQQWRVRERASADVIAPMKTSNRQPSLDGVPIDLWAAFRREVEGPDRSTEPKWGIAVSIDSALPP